MFNLEFMSPNVPHFLILNLIRSLRTKIELIRILIGRSGLKLGASPQIRTLLPQRLGAC